jgi:outer membrane protein assembly factor BamB
MPRQHRPLRTLHFACAAFTATLALRAADAPAVGIVTSEQPGWPQFGGPARDRVSTEKGLLQTWPEGGPRVLWTATGIGKGFSSPAISNGMLYITGDDGDDLVIHAFKVGGERAWKVKNGKSWKGSFPGARASCVIDGDAVYHSNAHGRVVCLDAATGAERWAVDTLERFAAKNIVWGITDNLIVDAKHVYVTPSGEKGLAAALDKKTGATVWATPGLAGQTAVYAAPLLVRRGDARQYINSASASVFGVDADTGELLWTVPQPVEKSVVMLAFVLYGDSIFAGNATPEKAEFFRIRLGAKGLPAEKVWSNSWWAVHGGLARVGERLYGTCISPEVKRYGLYAFDIPSGTMIPIVLDTGSGATLYADGRIYYVTEEGVVMLVRPTETGGEVVGRFSLAKEGAKLKEIWAHPVLLDGKLYLRVNDKLMCYDVRA